MDFRPNVRVGTTVRVGRLYENNAHLLTDQSRAFDHNRLYNNNAERLADQWTFGHSLTL